MDAYIDSLNKIARKSVVVYDGGLVIDAGWVMIANLADLGLDFDEILSVIASIKSHWGE